MEKNKYIDLNGNNQSLVNWKHNPLISIERLSLILGVSDAGLMVYDIDLNSTFYWTGTKWKSNHIYTTEIDFGNIGKYELKTNIVNSNVTTLDNIQITQSGLIPTGKDADEIEMDDLVFKVLGVNTGNFDLLVRSVDGSFLHDTFKINYILL